MKHILFAATALSALAFSSVPASAANLLVNGGFEAPAINTFFQNYGSGSTAVTGWTVDAFTPFGGGTGNVDLVDGTFTPGGPSPADEGTQFLDLVGFGTIGSIYQTFSTVAGQNYRVSFAYSHNLFGGDPSASAIAGIYDAGFAGGSAVLLAPFQSFAHNTGTSTNLDWRTYAFNFTATGANSTLAFGNNTGGNNAGVLLDNVSVSVPEPAAWALMISGFGLVGGAMRKRRTTMNVTYA